MGGNGNYRGSSTFTQPGSTTRYGHKGQGNVHFCFGGQFPANNVTERLYNHTQEGSTSHDVSNADAIGNACFTKGQAFPEKDYK